jgi:GntR family transcriptional regulator, gluconate operon transcriptional repressor
MSLQPVERGDLNSQVYDALAHAIASGVLRSGRRLVEDELAVEFGVSRAPVRDALRLLESHGLVESVGRRGKIVTMLTADDAWEVYSLRAAHEGLAFRLVAGRLDESGSAELMDIIGDMDTLAQAGDLPGLSMLDVKFHEAVCRMSGHGRLLQNWKNMSLQIRLLSHRVVDIEYAGKENLKAIPKRHLDLIDLLKAGGSDAAEQGVRSHIQVVGDRIVGVMREHEAADPSTSSANPATAAHEEHA